MSAKAKPRKRKRPVPTMRFKLDGKWWTVRVERPPDRETLDGCCVYRKRRIYLHPRAVEGDLLGICVHELAHCVIPPTDETHVRDLERVVCAVVRWAARRLNDGKISIGRHKAG